MSPEELRKMLRRQPFFPFRIHLSDSRVFDVRHREMVWVGHQVAIVGILAIDGYLDDHEIIAHSHIVSLE
ncbi:MAG: hypothetical protein ACRELF_21960, partial [Gemmataceae bacterium]